LFTDEQEDTNNIFGEFGESKQTILAIHCSSYYEKNKNDIILFYPKFTENPLFTATKEDLPYYKERFAWTMETTIKTILSREYEIHRLMEDMSKYRKNARNFLEHKKNEHLQAKGKQLNYAYYILGKLNEQHQITVSLSKEAEQIILNFEGDTQELENELTTAVKLAINTIPCPTGSIELDDFSLIGLIKVNIEEGKTITPSGKSTSSNINKESQMGQYSRTEAFLNRLEVAVGATRRKGEKPTGKNVARNMLPDEISAPAISDGISKHRDRILILMAREQSQWSQLRRHFRPIQNLIYTVPKGDD